MAIKLWSRNDGSFLRVSYEEIEEYDETCRDVDYSVIKFGYAVTVHFGKQFEQFGHEIKAELVWYTDVSWDMATYKFDEKIKKLREKLSIEELYKRNENVLIVAIQKLEKREKIKIDLNLKEARFLSLLKEESSFLSLLKEEESKQNE